MKLVTWNIGWSGNGLSMKMTLPLWSTACCTAQTEQLAATRVARGTGLPNTTRLS